MVKHCHDCSKIIWLPAENISAGCWAEQCLCCLLCVLRGETHQLFFSKIRPHFEGSVATSVLLSMWFSEVLRIPKWAVTCPRQVLISRKGGQSGVQELDIQVIDQHPGYFSPNWASHTLFQLDLLTVFWKLLLTESNTQPGSPSWSCCARASHLVKQFACSRSEPGRNPKCGLVGDKGVSVWAQQQRCKWTQFASCDMLQYHCCLFSLKMSVSQLVQWSFSKHCLWGYYN